MAYLTADRSVQLAKAEGEEGEEEGAGRPPRIPLCGKSTSQVLRVTLTWRLLAPIRRGRAKVSRGRAKVSRLGAGVGLGEAAAN